MLESLSNAMILNQINARPVLEVEMAIPKLELITLKKKKVKLNMQVHETQVSDFEMYDKVNSSARCMYSYWS